MTQNYHYGNNGATPLQSELRDDLMQGEAQQSLPGKQQLNQSSGYQDSDSPQPQQFTEAGASQAIGIDKQKRKGFLAFGVAVLIAAILSVSAFNTSASVDTTEAATEALNTGVSTTLPAGAVLASNDKDTSSEPTDYTITGTTDSPTTKIHVWDYAGEDGDYVQVLVDGSPITEEFMIKHQPREIEVPSTGTVQVKGIHDAGGGLTYAVHCDLNGESYFNNAPEGVLNTYTLMAG